MCFWGNGFVVRWILSGIVVVCFCVFFFIGIWVLLGFLLVIGWCWGGVVYWREIEFVLLGIGGLYFWVVGWFLDVLVIFVGLFIDVFWWFIFLLFDGVCW